MYKLINIAAIGAAVFMLVYILVLTGPYDPFVQEGANANRVFAGMALYEVNCAKCHGRNLEGQRNWKMPLSSGRLPAPPHDKSGHTWHHTDSAIIGITKAGLKPYAGSNYESDMPAFGAVLSDKEIEAILAFIKSTWPEREQIYQEQVTRQSSPQ